MSSALMEVCQLAKFANFVEDEQPELAVAAAVRPAADVIFGGISVTLWLAGAITGTVSAWES